MQYKNLRPQANFLFKRWRLELKSRLVKSLTSVRGLISNLALKKTQSVDSWA